MAGWYGVSRPEGSTVHGDILPRAARARIVKSARQMRTRSEQPRAILAMAPVEFSRAEQERAGPGQ